MRARWLTLMVLLISTAAGCRNLARPQWLSPGPTDRQRQNAAVHDPYPDTQYGPEALGTRPRDYSTSQSDSKRYPMIHGNQAPAGPVW